MRDRLPGPKGYHRHRWCRVLRNKTIKIDLKDSMIASKIKQWGQWSGGPIFFSHLIQKLFAIDKAFNNRSFNGNIRICAGKQMQLQTGSILCQDIIYRSISSASPADTMIYVFKYCILLTFPSPSSPAHTTHFCHFSDMTEFNNFSPLCQHGGECPEILWQKCSLMTSQKLDSFGETRTRTNLHDNLKIKST